MTIKECALKREKLHFDKWWTIFVLDTSINRISLFMEPISSACPGCCSCSPLLGSLHQQEEHYRPCPGPDSKPWEEDRIKWNKFKASGETYFGRQLASWSMCCVADTLVIPLWNLLTLFSVTFLVTLGRLIVVMSVGCWVNISSEICQFMFQSPWLGEVGLGIGMAHLSLYSESFSSPPSSSSPPPSPSSLSIGQSQPMAGKA